MAAIIPGLVGVVGAAAVNKFRKRNSNHEVQCLKEELNKTVELLNEQKTYTSEVASKCSVLEEVNQVLEDRNKTLEVQTTILTRDLDKTSASAQQLDVNVQQLTNDCQQLKKKATRLNVQNKGLQQSLQHKEDELSEFSAKMKEQTQLLQELAAEKQQLLKQLETEREGRVSDTQKFLQEKEQLLLKVGQAEQDRQQDKCQLEEERKRLAAELEGLRQSISKVLDGLFTNKLSESEVVAQLEGLGCEIRLSDCMDGQSGKMRAIVGTTSIPETEVVVPKAKADWVFQPQLVFDCPERLQRLVASSMGQQFPSRRLDSSVSMPTMRALQPADLNLQNRKPSISPPSAVQKAAPTAKLESSRDVSPTPAPAPAPAPTPDVTTSRSRKFAASLSFTNGPPHPNAVLTDKPQLDASKPAANANTFGNLLRKLSFKDPAVAPPLMRREQPDTLDSSERAITKT